MCSKGGEYITILITSFIVKRIMEFVFPIVRGCMGYASKGESF
jgi:hypothetical protein